jgi:hypothetical protein
MMSRFLHARGVKQSPHETVAMTTLDPHEAENQDMSCQNTGLVILHRKPSGLHKVGRRIMLIV